MFALRVNPAFRIIAGRSLEQDAKRVLPTLSSLHVRSLTTYKFGVSKSDLDIVKATLPAVAESGTDFTKHFYARVFKAHPELLDVFNQTNQTLENQPKKLLKTVALAAQAAIETGELPGEAIEGICQKHCALNLQPEAYEVVGEHLLGTIEDLLTDDKAVLGAWGSLYGDIAAVFTSRESELYDEMTNTPGGWLGRRKFTLSKKEKIGEAISRFQFKPVDGGATPAWKPGKFTTIWAAGLDSSGPHGHYTEQPRHYTLATPRNPEDVEKTLSISVKKEGLVSTLLHEATEGDTFELSAPFGCFDMSGAESLWLSGSDAPVIFLSAGVGCTPVLSMLENIYATRPATWLYAAQDGSVVPVYRERLREVAAVRNGDLQRRIWYSDPLPEDGVPGGYEEESSPMFNLAKYHYHGRMDLTSLLKDSSNRPSSHVLHLDNPAAQYYMCGPPGFMKAQKEGLMTLGVDETRIHFEGF